MVKEAGGGGVRNVKVQAEGLGDGAHSMVEGGTEVMQGGWAASKSLEANDSTLDAPWTPPGRSLCTSGSLQCVLGLCWKLLKAPIWEMCELGERGVLFMPFPRGLSQDFSLRCTKDRKVTIAVTVLTVMLLLTVAIIVLAGEWLRVQEPPKCLPGETPQHESLGHVVLIFS